MREYQVDDIKSYVVLANSEEEALEKFWAGEWERQRPRPGCDTARRRR